MSDAPEQAEQPQPTGETAIMIVPPYDICGFANHYRLLYMPETAYHIEPHITVTVPFVPFEELDEAVPRLAELLSHYPPMRLSIRGFDMFRDTGVLYLRLAKPERVLHLYETILAEFPGYPAYGGQYGEDLVPHMTVGKFDDPDELARVYNELSVMRLYIGWDVEHVVVKYRTEDRFWHTWADVPLRGKRAIW